MARRWLFVQWVLFGCGGVTVGPDAGPADTAVAADTSVATDTAVPGVDRPVPGDTAVPPADTAVPPDVRPPGPEGSALAYCRSTCAAVVRCNPGQVAASCELSCARRWGAMRLRPEVWARGAACAPGLSCEQVGPGDSDRFFEQCILPATAGAPSVVAQRMCEALEAFNRRVGGSCRSLPTGAECLLAGNLFQDEALDAVRGACFGPTATCDQARACFADRLGLPPSAVTSGGGP